MSDYNRFIKTYATRENQLHTLAGPDNSANGVSTPAAGLIQQEIEEGRVTNVLKTTGGSQTILGDKTFSGTTGVADVNASGDLTFTETVTSPATSSTYAIKSKQIVHTTTAAATNVIAINIPVGARIIGASAIVTTALTFGSGGADVDLTWTTSSEVIAAGIVDKNDKGSALFDQNAAAAVVSGSVETITATPDTGTIAAGGVIVVTAWYEQLTDLTDVA